MIGIGSGGNYALAAARALIDTDMDAEAIARKAMAIAAEICVYTNNNLVVESLDDDGGGYRLITTADSTPRYAGRARSQPPPTACSPSSRRARMRRARRMRRTLRFITGFNDIFVVDRHRPVPRRASLFAEQPSGPALRCIGRRDRRLGGLAEIFTRRKRMALPSIVLLGVFAVACL